MRKLQYLVDTFFFLTIYRFLDKYIANRIFSYYGADYRWGKMKPQNLDKSTGNLGYGLFHKAIIRNARPKRILCIGSMYGFIPYMLANACEENGQGHVDFVDAGYDASDKDDASRHMFGQGFWKRISPTSHFKYLLRGKYVSTYVMTSGEFAKKYKFKYDYVYIDGDHSYEGAIKDIRLFWPRLKKDGFICLHDIHLKKTYGKVKIEYWKAWRDLSPMPFKFELSNHFSGLGFIQKIGNSPLPKKITRH